MSFLRKAKNYAHLFLAGIASTIYFFPGRKLTIIGVTGTDGKTTTANLIYHILKNSGKKAAVISTIGAVIDGVNYDTGFHVTTPSPFAIQKYLNIARKKGCTHAVLEVTSHALDQNRVWGIEFTVGVLTNITHEHLDYHKNYQKYVDTKLRLFKHSKISVINSNGEWFPQVIQKVPSDKLISYSLHGNNTNDLTLLNTPFSIKTKLIGDFNLENILAATAVAKALGIDPSSIDRAIRTYEVPVGRQEIVHNKDFMVMVDFAHTANSFDQILPELRKRTTGRLIHVFGAAGERDHAKRPDMGKAASFYDDIIILTSEDPRSEKIEKINSDIKEGIQGFTKRTRDEDENTKALYEIPDRKEAIEKALSMASKHDTIVITGKGHERSINYGHGEEEWSDQATVKNYFRNNT
ncbi:MAG: UDP-N-acetylmuramoyl-L-alanyl-D-glutamate--2,6-diaminopimelate ligase [Candidatus Levybacteria bacterium]|nr:UDP-N-acetylmuramoyl-L-alanyl-D-glutamate--2,6-diaminopimelate ligase [Candidatus Levybacteria bacterium]